MFTTPVKFATCIGSTLSLEKTAEETDGGLIIIITTYCDADDVIALVTG